MLPFELVEGAIDLMVGIVRTEYNRRVDDVYAHYRDKSGAAAVDMPHLDEQRIYISERYEPVQVPAVFIVPSISRRDLKTHDRNALIQSHDVVVTVLVEDLRLDALTRKTWRYALAMNNLFHERAERGPRGSSLVTLIQEIDYSPVYMQRVADSNTRTYRKDASLRVAVRHGETFPG